MWKKGKRIKCVSGLDLAAASGEPRCQKVQKRVGFEAVVVVKCSGSTLGNFEKYHIAAKFYPLFYWLKLILLPKEHVLANKKGG